MPIEKEKPWFCRIRMCRKFSGPLATKHLIETQKGNREKVLLQKYVSACLECGRLKLSGYVEVKYNV